MVYPQTGLPLVVEIAPGAAPAADPSTWTWVDVTAFVRVRDRITISAGRGDWGDRVDAGSCSLVFDGRSGDFAQHNPAGQWYGRLGRDTPLRVRLRRVEDGFGRSVTGGMGVADSGQTWTIASGSAASVSVAGGVARHSHSAVNGLIRTVTSANLLDCEQLVDVSTSALLTGAALVTGLVFRHTAGLNYYWLRAEFKSGGTGVMLKISKVVAGTFTDLAVLDPVPALAYAANTPLRVRASVDGDRLGIKVWPAAGVEPAGWQLTATDATHTGPGATGFQTWLVSGNTNALPVTASFDNYRVDVDLGGGLVPAWVPRWDITGKERVVPVTARGALHRLQPAQGKTPQHSPLRRTIAATGPVAYYPAEDGIVATAAGSAVSGQNPLVVSGGVEFKPVEDFTFWSTTTRYGTSALADLAAGGSLAVNFGSGVAAATQGLWTVHAVGAYDVAFSSGDIVLMEWTTPGGTYTRWQLVLLKATLHTQVIAYTGAGVATVVVDRVGVLGGFRTWIVSAEQVGADIYVRYWLPNGTSLLGVVAGTLRGVASKKINPTGTTSSIAMPFGHLAVWDLGQVPYDINGGLDSYGDAFVDPAATSYRQEAAHVRLARLAAEDGVTLHMPAVGTDAVTRMGWQPAGTPLELYQQCEDADGGVLYERPPFALAYQPRSARYNQTPALTLNAAGDLGATPEPDADRQGYRNRWTVERADGASAVAETADVTSGQAVVYDDSVTLNLATDDPLPDHTSWRLHLSTGEGLRWPKLDLDLAARPALIDAWLACRIGSRILATDPPEDVAGQDIDVMLEGYTLTLGYKDFDVAATCSPAQPWAVAEADGPQLAGADGSTLAADITASATTLRLASTPENGTWTEDPANMPLDLRVGGERVTVSGISPAVADVFSRTVSNGWGAANSGQAWSTTGGSVSDYGVSGGAGQHVHNGVAVLHHAFIAPGGDRDFSMATDVTIPVMPSGAAITVWVVVRGVDTSNYYAAQLGISPGGATTLTWFKRVSGSLSSLGLGVNVGTHAAGTTWRISAAISGTNLLAKAWRPTAAPDPGWQATATDATIAAGTQVGILSRLEAGNTNTLPVTVTVDNFTVVAPQSVVMSARGVNGIQRAWPAGTDVDVWAPAIAPL